MTYNKVSMIGLGYIGLPTAAMLASRGIEVVGVDINKKAVDTINQGNIHIVEPGLEDVVRSVVATKKLRATLTPEPAEVFIIAVPTPFHGTNHDPDLSYIHAAAKSIAPVLKKGNLVILESTSPVGTTDQLGRWLAELRPDLKLPMNAASKDYDVCLAYCPERVLPGKVLHELKQNDRVVGGVTAECAKRAVALYKTFVDGECFITNSKTAEMVKLTENSFRDVNIAFANELSILCDKQGIDTLELIELANKHPRVSILQPGPGVGGHCISVDPWFIVAQNPTDAKLIHTARLVNDAKPHWVVEKIANSVKNSGQRTGVACLGLSFKANIDDLRESPAMEIVHHLAEKNIADLYVVEPYVEELPPSLKSFGNVHFCDADQALRQSSIVLVLVNHDEFYKIGPSALEGKTIVDTRGVFRFKNKSLDA